MKVTILQKLPEIFTWEVGIQQVHMSYQKNRRIGIEWDIDETSETLRHAEPKNEDSIADFVPRNCYLKIFLIGKTANGIKFPFKKSWRQKFSSKHLKEALIKKYFSTKSIPLA
jgi:hypothetical protein